MVQLSKGVLQKFLLSGSQWELDISKNALTRTFQFKTYADCVTFALQVTELSEKLNHHPDITIKWGSVVITSTTHDSENAVTAKDIEIAQAIDVLEIH